MKALIITTQYVNNYGAVLQSYAFHDMLNELQLDHDFLLRESKDKQLFFRIRPLGKRSLYYVKCNIMILLQLKTIKKRYTAFELFRNLMPQTELFKTEDQIFKSEKLKKYDVYITGGDQMFNRTCLEQTSNLLEFAPNNKKLISYSTSSGSDEFTDKESEYLSKRLKRYDFLSLREENSITQICKEKNIPYSINYDSSLLLPREKWAEISLEYPGVPSRYILVYELLLHEELNKVVRKARIKYKLPVVVISVVSKTSVDADIVIKDAGPAHFLSLFKNAEAIITTSFHGTCFSIIFAKPFISLVRNNEKRITGLLTELGLENHFSVNGDKMPIEIENYAIIEKQLQNERKKTIDILRECIYG